MKRFFYLQKSDRKILMALLVVAAVALTVLWLTGSWANNNKRGERSEERKVGSQEWKGERPIDEGGAERETALFDFDPNTADSTALLKLGLQRWQVRNVYRYRRAGGIYRRPEDFARLYGLTVGQYRRLEPHIRIGRDYRPAAELVGDAKRYDGGKTTDETPRRDSLRYPKKLEPGSHVVLNTADTAELRRVPGIGVYFANESFPGRLCQCGSAGRDSRLPATGQAVFRYQRCQSPPSEREPSQSERAETSSLHQLLPGPCHRRLSTAARPYQESAAAETPARLHAGSHRAAGALCRVLTAERKSERITTGRGISQWECLVSCRPGRGYAQ